MNLLLLLYFLIHKNHQLYNYNVQLHEPHMKRQHYIVYIIVYYNSKLYVYMLQVLDTADVAQQVREILSINNIGQRLFARHVLGLSQGTVSELLSKPKHWDKLTEKGRESYRRMHQWVRDGGNIAVLKAYAPKKGQLNNLGLHKTLMH